MKFLTRRSVGPLASETSFAAANKKYEAYLTDITRDMSSAVIELAKKINFHDGRIVQVNNMARPELNIIYLLGDISTGYFELSVDYKNSNSDWFHTKKFEKIVLNRRSEILCSEITKIDNKRWSHNLLFDPSGSIEIYFQDVAIERKFLNERVIGFFGDPFIVT